MVLSAREARKIPQSPRRDRAREIVASVKLAIAAPRRAPARRHPSRRWFAVRLVRVIAREMPVHFALDVADDREGGERQDQRDKGDRIITAAAGQPERADEPDAGAGGDAQDRAPGLNDGPRAEERHSRDHRFDHASGIRPDGGGSPLRSSPPSRSRPGRTRRTQRHQHMGPQARGLAPDLPVQTDDHAEQQRQDRALHRYRRELSPFLRKV